MTPPPQGRTAAWEPPPSLSNAMEAAKASAADLGRTGRRIMSRIWDLEPVNDTAANQPVWLLGRHYTLDTSKTPPRSSGHAPPTPSSPRAAISPEPTTPGESSATATTTDVTSPAPTAADPASNSSLSTTTHPSPSSEDPSSQDGNNNNSTWPPAFLDDFSTRIWLTYRTGFVPIPQSTDPKAAASLPLTMRLRTSFSSAVGPPGDASRGTFTSDTGWGCMIRSAQSLWANAMLIERMGRDWRRSADPRAERDILQLFADDPHAPYSLHNFVKLGEAECGKFPGEWFGPSAAAHCIITLAKETNASPQVYSTGNLPDVYEDRFMAIAKPDGTMFRPTLVLVGTRLGIDRINQVYEQALIAALQMPQSIGIAGGRPSSSHYFIGVQGQWLFYLDPHHPRPALPYHADLDAYTPADLESCHTRRLRHLHIADLDPSMLIGFLIRDDADWHAWKRAVREVQGKAIINVSAHDPALGMSLERAEAVDEVETFSDEDCELAATGGGEEPSSSSSGAGRSGGVDGL